MKKKILLLTLIVIGAISSEGIFAQKGVEDGSKFGHGQDSINCLINTSLYTESAKNKNYADALKPWKECFRDCPASTVNLYFYGAKIISWQISTATTPADKQSYFNSLMQLYDQRIKYFGNNPKYPEGYILELKSFDYYKYYPEETKEIYDLLNKVVNLRGEESKTATLQLFMQYTGKMYAAKSIDADEVMNNYNQVSGLIDKTDEGQKLQTSIDQMFVQTGVANCETLTELFQSQLDANKTNVAWLNKTLSFMSRAKCDTSQLYFQVSEMKYEIEPSGPSALGLAQKYLKNDDINKALSYLQNAVDLTDDATTKATYYYQMAQISYAKKKGYPLTRAYCLKAIANNPNYGAPYILIAQMYAASASAGTIGTKEMQNRAGYWAAYDKAERARSVDSSEENVKIATSLMNQYRQQFPTIEVIFMDPAYANGSTVTVGGWINESTVVRKK